MCPFITVDVSLHKLYTYLHVLDVVDGFWLGVLVNERLEHWTLAVQPAQSARHHGLLQRLLGQRAVTPLERTLGIFVFLKTVKQSVKNNDETEIPYNVYRNRCEPVLASFSGVQAHLAAGLFHHHNPWFGSDNYCRQRRFHQFHATRDKLKWSQKS